MKSAFAAIGIVGVAAVGGAFVVYAGYDDSPGGQLLGILLVLAAMGLGVRSAARRP